MISQKIYIPVQYRREVPLLDGSVVEIRPITSEDCGPLLDFFNRLSPDTRYLRFHYAKCELTLQERHCFCDVDYKDDYALVAEKVRHGVTEIVGVGRYSRLPGSTTAEAAFVVEDREQGKGIGTHLLEELAKVARKSGIARFVAELMTDNVIMLSIFKRYAPDLVQEVDGASRRIIFSV